MATAAASTMLSPPLIRRALPFLLAALVACDAAPPAPPDDDALGVVEESVQAVGPPGHWESIPIRRGSDWQVDASGVDRGSSWRTYVYGEWPELPGPLGYGEGYLSSILGYGPDPAHKPMTTYFRRRTYAGGTIDKMYLRVMYDDGFVFYINGKEGGRAGMPSGPISYSTPALGHEALGKYVTFDISSQIPNLGHNTPADFAFEVHQASPSSSDLVFDAELVVWVAGDLPAVSETNVPTQSYWRYWTSPGAPPAAWRDPSFDATGWTTATGPFGFGEDYLVTDVAPGPITSYFRTQFEYTGGVDKVILDAMYDDGLVVYLNGHEIARPSMPAGPVSASTLAFGHEALDRYETFDVSAAAAPYVVQGMNTVAVEVHQGGTQSSDLVFDLGLRVEGKWQSQPHPAAANVAFHGVAMIDASHGFVVGDDGLVLETHDGGASWQWRMSVTGASLEAIQFVDPTHGFIVGEGGVILNTVDGGVSWRTQSAGTSNNLVGLSMLSPTEVWVVGDGGVYHTTDAGDAWSAMPAPSVDASDIDFADAQHGWVVGVGYYEVPDGGSDTRGAIYATSDGGLTWTRQWLAPNHNFPLFDVEVVDASTVWAVGEMSLSGDGAVLLVTHDGGATWTSVDAKVQMGLAAIDFVDSDYGWAVGDAGVITHTEDGGATWTAQQGGTDLYTRPWLADVDFVDRLNGWAVGTMTGTGSADGRILHTTTGGK